MLRSIKNGKRGFGLRLESAAQGLEVDLDGLGRASIDHHTDEGFAITTLLRISESGEVTQSLEIRSQLDSVSHVNFTMDFGISVNRASYGQLTEGGPIPIPKSENKISTTSDQQGFSITNAPLGAHLDGYLEGDGQRIDMERAIQEQTFIDSPVTGRYSGSLEVPPRGVRSLTAKFILQPGVVPHSGEEIRLPQRMGLPKLQGSPEATGRFIVRRNLEYILGNCAVPVPPSKQAVCLLTDHVALPLGWMRDN